MNDEKKIETIVLWYNHKIVGLHVNGELVWQYGEVQGTPIVDESELEETIVILRPVETIEYCQVLLHGLATDRLVMLLKILQQKIKEMQKLSKDSTIADIFKEEIQRLASKDSDVCEGNCNICSNCGEHDCTCQESDFNGEEWEDEDE